MLSGVVLGGRGAQARRKVGSGSVPVIRGRRFLDVFWPKMEIPSSILVPLQIERGTQNRHFERKLVLLTPKMTSKRRPGAKVEKWMKNESKNRRVGEVKMMKNHWFLCVFVKERRSEKSRKMDAKMTSKSHEKSFKSHYFV